MGLVSIFFLGISRRLVLPDDYNMELRESLAGRASDLPPPSDSFLITGADQAEAVPGRIVMAMSKSRSVLGLLSTLVLLGSPAVHGGEPTAEEVLRSSGLKRSGFAYIHQESETQARKKANDARLTYRQLGFAHMQVTATQQGNMEMLQEFDNQRMFLTEELAMVNQNLSMLSGSNGNNVFGGAGGFGNTGGVAGVGGGFGNNRYAGIQQNQLNNQRNMLNNSLNQLNRRYEQIRNQAQRPEPQKGDRGRAQESGRASS